MVPNEDENSIILRVDEISKSSAGRSICRIDTDSMRQLGISAGDIVEVIGVGEWVSGQPYTVDSQFLKVR